MSESQTAAVQADPQEVARAHDMWLRFTRSMKLGAIVISAGVIVLAWITL